MKDRPKGIMIWIFLLTIDTSIFDPWPLTSDLCICTTAPLPHSLGYTNPMTSEAVPEDYLDPVLSMKADYAMDSKPTQEYLNPDGHQYIMDSEPDKLELTLQGPLVYLYKTYWKNTYSS